MKCFCTGGALAAAAALFLLPCPSLWAATPASGTVSQGAPTLSYNGGPFVAPNRTDPLLGDGSTLQCANPAVTCDDFALTVQLPEPLPSDSISVRLEPVDPASTSDYDI